MAVSDSSSQPPGKTSTELAVLFADIAGSTRLYDTLGDTQAKVLIDECIGIMRDVVGRYSGRVIKTIGDEVMCVLPDADSGHLAATDMQLRITALPPVSDVKRAIRVGFHFGPVIEEASDVFGDTVNLEVAEGKAETVFHALQQALPDSGMEHVGQSHVGAAIGKETQLNALLAVGVSMLTILVYIAFRFEFGYGVGAVVATLHDLLMTIGVFVLTDRQFNAPMVAAILCIAGYSINETVVVFDRIREELKFNLSGTLREVVNAAIGKVFARTIMTASTTFLAALALFVFGGGVLRDISFTFLVGILTSTFSAIFIAAQVFYWWHKGDRTRVEGTPEDLLPRRPWERPSAAPKLNQSPVSLSAPAVIPVSNR